MSRSRIIIKKNLSFFVFISSCYGQELDVKILGKHTINIYNGLPKNRDKLFLHCSSKDDDLGNHTLFRNQVESWRFRTNFWGTTLFYCHFWWGLKTQAFVVFYAGWDADGYHHTYSYLVKDDAIYLSYDEKPPLSNVDVADWENVK